jgi:hypothetical protein
MDVRETRARESRERRSSRYRSTVAIRGAGAKGMRRKWGIHGAGAKGMRRKWGIHRVTRARAASVVCYRVVAIGRR